MNRKTFSIILYTALLLPFFFVGLFAGTVWYAARDGWRYSFTLLKESSDYMKERYP